MNDDFLDAVKNLYATTSITNPIYSDGRWPIDANTVTSISTSTVHKIEGEMLIASLTLDQDVIERLGKDEVKRKLAEKIAVAIVENNMVEFTQTALDPLHFKITIRARAFLVPKADVQLLRKAGY